LRAGREKGHFNTLGESGRVAGGRVEALYFLLTFAMCYVVPFTVSKSKSSHEDAGQDRGKFDSGSRRGGDPCSFSHRLRAERVEPFTKGGGRGARGRAPVCGDRMGSVSGDCVGSVCGDRMGRFYGDRMGHFCGDRMGSVSGNSVGRLICYTATRSTRGNLFMLPNKHHNRHYRRLQKRPRGRGTR
jgi:hypothetical protein